MKAKRIVTLALTLALLTACSTTGSSSGTSSSGSTAGSTPSSSSMSGDSSGGSAAPGSIRVGIGAVASTADSIPAAADAPGKAHFSTTICAVAVDENDKIVSVKFDTVQSNLDFDAAGAFTGDVKAEIKTNKEHGFDYGLKESSSIGKEWFEQIESLEGWMLGKTVPDALNLTVTDKNIPDLEELKSSISIPVADQMAALKKAHENAK